MVRQVMELARSMGHVEEDEQGLLNSLCERACQQLTEELREGVKPEDCAQSFVVAGAWMALAGLEVGRSSGQARRFTAGDVTVDSGDAGQRAQMLYAQAKRLMSGWVKDRKFAFYGVDG